MEQSKNQLYRKYQSEGGNLSFKDWIQHNLRESVKQAIVDSEFLNYDGMVGQDGSNTADTTTVAAPATTGPLPYKPVLDNTTFLGIPDSYLYMALIGVAGYAVYKLVKSRTK